MALDDLIDYSNLIQYVKLGGGTAIITHAVTAVYEDRMLNESTRFSQPTTSAILSDEIFLTHLGHVVYPILVGIGIGLVCSGVFNLCKGYQKYKQANSQH